MSARCLALLSLCLPGLCLSLESPERPGALQDFLTALAGRWNISLFHYRNHGAAYGRVLAGLMVLLPDDIQHSNALKGLLSMVINAVAVGYFALFGPVEWTPALVMAGGALAGGYLGVGVARMLGEVWLRRAVVMFGVVVAGILLFA